MSTFAKDNVHGNRSRRKKRKVTLIHRAASTLKENSSTCFDRVEMVYPEKSHVGGVRGPVLFSRYKFSHLARSSPLHPERPTSQACSTADTLLSAITAFVLFIFPAACSQFSYCAQPAAMNDGSRVFPLKLNVFRATSRDCGDGISIMVARGNLLLSDAVLL